MKARKIAETAKSEKEELGRKTTMFDVRCLMFDVGSQRSGVSRLR